MAAGGWSWARKALAAGRPLFRGRALLFTNTLGCGSLMAAGDGVRQVWEVRARPGQKFSARRSGEPDPSITLGTRHLPRGTRQSPQRDPASTQRNLSVTWGPGTYPERPVSHLGTWHPPRGSYQSPQRDCQSPGNPAPTQRDVSHSRGTRQAPGDLALLEALLILPAPSQHVRSGLQHGPLPPLLVPVAGPRPTLFGPAKPAQRNEESYGGSGGGISHPWCLVLPG